MISMTIIFISAPYRWLAVLSQWPPCWLIAANNWNRKDRWTTSPKLFEVYVAMHDRTVLTMFVIFNIISVKSICFRLRTHSCAHAHFTRNFKFIEIILCFARIDKSLNCNCQINYEAHITIFLKYTLFKWWAMHWLRIRIFKLIN